MTAYSAINCSLKTGQSRDLQVMNGIGQSEHKKNGPGVKPYLSFTHASGKRGKKLDRGIWPIGKETEQFKQIVILRSLPSGVHICLQILQPYPIGREV